MFDMLLHKITYCLHKGKPTTSVETWKSSIQDGNTLAEGPEKEVELKSKLEPLPTSVMMTFSYRSKEEFVVEEGI